MEVKTKSYIVETTVFLEEEKKGVLYVRGKPEIRFVTIPNIREHTHSWSPHELFLASLNSSFMTLFLELAHQKSIKILLYECRTSLVMEAREDIWYIQKVTIYPKIKAKGALPQLIDLLHQARTQSFALNSLKAPTSIEPSLEVF